MKIRLVFLGTLLITATLSACQWGNSNSGLAEPNITTDTLTYTNKLIKQRAADCGNKPDSACTVVKINYPEFKGQPALNDSIKRKLNMFSSDNPDRQPDTSFANIAKVFLKTYQDDTTPKNVSGIVYTLDLSAKVARQDSSLASIQLDGYNFQGGAHGASYTCFINWDVKAGKNLKLNDLLVSNYQDSLNTVAETIFREQEKLTPATSLETDYFFKDAKFALNDNFAVTPIGLKFLYNQYEIKPYAAGQTTLLIPYAKIKSLLKPNTVITQYLK